MIANIEAGGTAWNATGVSHSAFFELPWTPADLAQAMSRTEGVNRGKVGIPSQSWFLIAKGTVEEKVMTLLDEKARNAAAAIDGIEFKDGFENMTVNQMMDWLENLLLKNPKKST